MKKLISILLAVIFCTVILSSCNTNNGAEYSIESFDEESRISVGNESQDEKVNGDFLVKEKKYTFEDNNLVILDVTNETDKNYSVTIKGTYFDESAKEIKSETKTFDQYSSGYHGYFLFQPNIKFDSFKYTLEAKETDGPFYAKDIGFKFNGLQETKVTITEEEMKNNFTKYPTILASFSNSYSGDVKVQAYVQWFLINENDEIIDVVFKAPWLEPNQSLDGESHHIMYQTMDEDFEWPEAWKGTIRALPIVEKVGPDIT